MKYMKQLINLLFILLSFNIYAQQEFPTTYQVRIIDPVNLDLSIINVIVYPNLNVLDIRTQTPTLYKLPEFNFTPNTYKIPDFNTNLPTQFSSPPVFNWTEHFKLE